MFGADHGPSELPNKFAMAVRTPIGVCAMITHGIFPWHSIRKAAAGHRLRQHVRHKAGAGYPAFHLSIWFARSPMRAYQGVINIVTGFGSSVGTPMTEHPEVRVVSLTGSTEVGASSEQLPQRRSALLAGTGWQEIR